MGNQILPIGNGSFLNGGIINMGAYDGSIEASKSYFGEPVFQTIVVGDINDGRKIEIADSAIMALH